MSQLVLEETLGERLRRIAPIYATVKKLCEEHGLPAPTLAEASDLVLQPGLCRRDRKDIEWAISRVYGSVIGDEKVREITKAFFDDAGRAVRESTAFRTTGAAPEDLQP
jgi:hypothetical protein